MILGVLENTNESKLAALSFDQPFKKTNHVIFLSEIRNLNRRLKHKPYPMRRICGMLFKLEGCKYATPLDLNMSYYHIIIIKEASNLCNIILPW